VKRPIIEAPRRGSFLSRYFNPKGAAVNGALERRRNPFKELWFEDLYDPALSLDQKAQKQDDIFTFFGFSVSRDNVTIRRRVVALFDPKNSQLNSAATYRRIPGINQIEERFGSWERGWLFR
jgi:hypothetical protein